jgi:molecular chaperone DnaK
MIIGIDFGTTNTAVSVLKDGEPVVLEFGGAQNGRSYVPSIVALHKNDHTKRSYGMIARGKAGWPDWLLFPNFKMLFGESKTDWQRFWGTDVARALTAEFFAHIFGLLKKEHHLQPERALVTIPDIWQSQEPSKREKLIECFNGLGLKKTYTQSEPIAAAGYYLHCFRKKYNHDFSGHLLVCDCGGGTLDFCLARVDNNDGEDGMPTMMIQDRGGDGTVDGDTLGHAGVAFDRAVVDELFPDLRKTKPHRYHSLLSQFEEQKITHTEAIAKGLRSYRRNPLSMVDESLLYLDYLEREVEVSPKVFCDIFDVHIKPKIDRALQMFQESFEKYGVNINDSDHFRVVLVGGFSRFYLVQEAVGKAVTGQFITSTDRRFEDILSLEDRALAIAKGAALIGNELIKVVHTCPFNVGVMIAIDGDIRPSPPLLEQGVKVEEYWNVVWLEDRVRVTQGGDGYIAYFTQVRGSELKTIRLEKADLEVLIPEGQQETKLQVGFSINEDNLFFLHARDRNRTISISLGSLWDKEKRKS